MRLLAQLLAGEHARPADSVAAGGRPEEDDRLARGARAGAGDAVGWDEPDAHRVDEAVVPVRVGEHRVSAHRGNADCVPVVADPLHGAFEVPVRLAEAEPVQQRNRPRSHGDDVADDPAHAGGRPLKGLDG